MARQLTTGAALAGLRAKDDDTVEALGAISLFNTEVLAAVARGELDLNEIARFELASRGSDATGRWVGFDVAARRLLGAGAGRANA